MIVRACLAAGVALLAAAPAAAQTPHATAQPTAQLTVRFEAAPGAAFYHWDFGDGSVGEGAVVEHVYARPGRYRATLTTDAGQAAVDAVAYRIAFRAPAQARFRATARFSGSIAPALRGARVELLGPAGRLAAGRTGPKGGFALQAPVRGPGPFRMRVAGLLSDEAGVLVRPRLEVRLAGSQIVGEPLALVARVRPARAGTLVATVRRNGQTIHAAPLAGRLPLKTGARATYRAQVRVEPAAGFAAVSAEVRGMVARPTFSRGSRGPAVRSLQERLRRLSYALPAADGVYGLATVEAVLAFQAVEGLPRTGRVDAATWRRLANAKPPRPRFGGTHLEISKGRQYLLAVENGRVRYALHVSTGKTGNTPIGHWRIYRRVVGWDWILWYPMYFLRGFAIHGYPEVPTYPASRGCVRVPMWIAPRLFHSYGLGRSVHVYW